MCEFLIFNTQKRYEKQKNFGNFSATFWQHLDTFIGNFFGINRQLVAKPSLGGRCHKITEVCMAL